MDRKIPKSAKVVFRGILFDVYHWKQRLFDGSYTTFEAVRRADAVRVLPTKGDKVLMAEETLISNGSKVLGLFGGRVERGEPHLNSAKRELLEEAGYASNDWALIRVHEPFASLMIDYKVFIFAARNCKKVGDPHLEGGEKIAAKEVSFSAMLNALSKPVGSDSTISGYFTKAKKDRRELARLRNMLFKR
jgi:ADP-ribose pyrophosphatase